MEIKHFTHKGENKITERLNSQKKKRFSEGVETSFRIDNTLRGKSILLWLSRSAMRTGLLVAVKIIANLSTV